jgi:hypothetical protein
MAVTKMWQSMEEEMTIGLLLKAGADTSQFHAEQVQKAEDRYGATGCDLRAIAKEIIAICGMPDPQNSKSRIQAAFSSITGTAIFDRVIGLVLKAPFRGGANTVLGWVSERDVENYKIQKRPAVQHGESMPRLPRGGEAEHYNLNIADSEEYKVLRYARQFVADEQDLVSDDLDAILAPARSIDEAGLRLKMDLIYSILLANAALADGTALFDASRSNLNTSAALSESNLDSAMGSVKVRQENGSPLGLTAQHLIVPPELEGLAKRLIRNMDTRNGTNLTVRSESRLSNGVTDPTDDVLYAGSATTWFAAIASGDGPTIEVGFIDSPLPKLRRFTLDKGQWGVGYDVTMDVGAKALSGLGLEKSTA